MITVVKEAASAAKAAGKIDLYEKIVDLHSKINDLQSELQNKAAEIEALREERAKLQSALQFSESLTLNGVWYFAEGDPYPFCPNCLEGNKLAIHLRNPNLGHSGETRGCPNCGRGFTDVSKARPHAPSTISRMPDSWMG